MEDILYINSTTDIRVKEMVEIIPSKDKELPNLIILTILSAGTGEVTPVFLKDDMEVIFTSIDEIGTKFILDDKEITSEDFLLIEVKASYFGLLFEDSNEHTLKVSLINSSINQSTFNNNEYLTKVTIGTSITSIGDNAFDGCSGLTSVTIPNSVTSIGDNAFDGCSGLTSVTIGNSVTSIGSGAFYNCIGLTSVVVENGNPKYDSRNNCNAIIESESNTLIVGCNSTIIPNSVTSIGDDAFLSCSGLTSMTIPNSVTSIGDGAFCGCSGLTSVTIPNSVTSIDSGAFYGCTGLTSMTIPNSVTSIREYAFWGCSGLISVTIPNSVTEIGSGAFCNCSGLTSVTIPNSVTEIGEEAFCGCTGLTSITSLAITTPVIQSSTFKNVKTNGTLHVPAGSNYSTWMSTSNYYLGKYSWTKVEDA